MDYSSDENDGVESDSSGFIVKGSLDDKNDTDIDEQKSALYEKVSREPLQHVDNVEKDCSEEIDEPTDNLHGDIEMNKQDSEQAAEHEDTALDEQEHKQSTEHLKAIHERDNIYYEKKRPFRQEDLSAEAICQNAPIINKTNEENPVNKETADQDTAKNKSSKVIDAASDVTRDEKEEVLFEDTLEVQEIRPGSLPKRLMKEIFDDYEEIGRPRTSSSLSTMVSTAYMEDRSEKVQDILADWQDSDSNDEQEDDDWEEYESVNRMDVTENSFVDLAVKLSASQANLPANKQDIPNYRDHIAANKDLSAANRDQNAAERDQVGAKRFCRLSEMEFYERTSTAMSSSTASEGFVDKCADFMCDICQEFFDSRTDLKQHKKEKHPKVKRTYKCNSCDKTFALGRNLRIHKKIHVKKPFRCEICHCMFANIGDLNAHYRDHESKDIFNCNSCKKIFGNKESLDRHKRDKHFNYSCELCKKRFETTDDLSGHKNSNCEEKYVSCDVCDAKVNNKYDLQKHKRMHTGEKPYSCNLCDRRFISNSALTGHKKIIHSNEKDSKELQYSCDTCGFRYTDPTKLLNHKSMHGQKPFFCTICKLLFTLESDLTAHELAYPGTKHVSCDVCEKTITSKEALTRHKRLHTGERPYPCNICDKTFASNSNFRSHIRSHTKDVTYSCNHCDKSFPYKVSLNRHLKNKHDDLEFSSDGTITPTQHRLEFACDICEKSYPLKNSLTRHMRINHGKLPIVSTENNSRTCELCNKIITNSNFSRHMQKVHAPRTNNNVLKCVRGPCRFCGEDLALKNMARHESSCLKNPDSSRPKSRVESIGQFSCDDCDKSYVKKCSLYRHIRSAHNKEPSYIDHDEKDEEEGFNEQVEENCKQSEMDADVKTDSADDKETEIVKKIKKNIYVCLKYDDLNNVYN